MSEDEEPGASTAAEAAAEHDEAVARHVEALQHGLMAASRRPRIGRKRTALSGVVLVLGVLSFLVRLGTPSHHEQQQHDVSYLTCIAQKQSEFELQSLPTPDVFGDTGTTTGLPSTAVDPYVQAVEACAKFR